MSFYFTILSPTDHPIFALDFGTSRNGGDSACRFTRTQLEHAPRIVLAALDILGEVQWGTGSQAAVGSISSALAATSGNFPSGGLAALIAASGGIGGSGGGVAGIPGLGALTGGGSGGGGSGNPNAATPNGTIYFKQLDRHPGNAFVSAFITDSKVRFMLLSQPLAPSALSAAMNMPANFIPPENPSAFGKLDRTTNAFIDYDPATHKAEESVGKFFVEVYALWTKTIMNPFHTFSYSKPFGDPIFKTRVLNAAKKL